MYIKKTDSVFAMDKGNVEVLKANSGDVVTFQTMDCFSETIKSEAEGYDGIDWNRINPATGPLYVNGAEPGDALKVEILKISLADTGVMMAEPGFGPLGEYVQEGSVKIFTIEDNCTDFNGIKLDLNPMVGVIGTAPKSVPVPTGTPDGHGGNLDCKEVREGNSIYLPVEVEGGMLAMGDLHAAMGDGEVGGAGIEVSGEVEVRVSVVKNFAHGLPMIESEDAIMILSSKDSMEEASKDAVIKMAELLVAANGLTMAEAGMFISAVGDLKVCQIVDPKLTMRVEMAKKYLKNFQI